MEYTFKRDFYNKLKASVQEFFATALLGPLSCGETTALLQLNSELPNARYYNVKSMTSDEHVVLLSTILDSIKANEDAIYLVDEITYIDCADIFIGTLAVESEHYDCPNTHIVFTGSQSYVLKCWIDRSFRGCAGYVRADFMNYAEWLRYMSETVSMRYNTPTESNYTEFLSSIDKFYTLSSIEDYLHACLEETVVSNNHSMNVIFNNDIDGLSEPFLLDILFSTLVPLQDRISDMTVIKKQVTKATTRYYSTLKSAEVSDIINALMFLVNCGLIRVLEASDSSSFRDLSLELCRYSSAEHKQKIFNKQNLFSRLNISFVHPMIYIALLRLVLDGKEIPSSLLH